MQRLFAGLIGIVLLGAASSPPPLDDTTDGVDQWIQAYEARQEGELADHGRDVLKEYWRLLKEARADEQEPEIRAMLLENALVRAQRNIQQRLRAEAIEANTRNRVGYVVIPIKGTIGRDVLPSAFEEILEQSKGPRVEHVIFEIDSPGGLVAQAEAIGRIMQKYSEHFTYYSRIHEALSAAIVIPFNSNHWEAAPGARMGAATSYTVGEDIPSDIDKKMNSAWAASVRAFAQQHGYPGEMVQAMIVPEASAVGWLDGDGQPQIAGAIDPSTAMRETVFSAGAGEVLTVSGDELIRIGLADPIGHDPSDTIRVDDDVQLLRGRVRPERIIERHANRRRAAIADEEQRHREIEELRQNLENGIPVMVSMIRQRMQQAQQADPRNYTYQYEPETGRFTRNSLLAWRDRTSQAINQWHIVLDKCEILADAITEAERVGIRVAPADKAVLESTYDHAHGQLRRLDRESRRRTIDGL